MNAHFTSGVQWVNVKITLGTLKTKANYQKFGSFQNPALIVQMYSP